MKCDVIRITSVHIDVLFYVGSMHCLIGLVTSKQRHKLARNTIAYSYLCCGDDRFSGKGCQC